MTVMLNILIKNPVSLADYFDYEKDGIVIDEPVRIIEKMDVVEKEFRESMSHRLEKGSILPGQTEVLYSKGEVFHKLALHSLMAVSVLDCKIPELNISGHYDINAKGIGSYNNSFETLVSDIKNWKKKKIPHTNCIRLGNKGQKTGKRPDGK